MRRTPSADVVIQKNANEVSHLVARRGPPDACQGRRRSAARSPPEQRADLKAKRKAV